MSVSFQQLVFTLRTPPARFWRVWRPIRACRGRGYARRMMAHATNAALAQGLEPWLLTAEDGIAAFHRACGYEDAGLWS